jgi:hypothetical protein
LLRKQHPNNEKIADMELRLLTAEHSATASVIKVRVV